VCVKFYPRVHYFYVFPRAWTKQTDEGDIGIIAIRDVKILRSSFHLDGSWSRNNDLPSRNVDRNVFVGTKIKTRLILDGMHQRGMQHAAMKRVNTGVNI